MKFRPSVPFFAFAPLLSCLSSPVVPSGPPDAQSDASPVVDATAQDASVSDTSVSDTSVSDTSVSDARSASSDSSAIDGSTAPEAATSRFDASGSDASGSDASSSDASGSDASSTGPVPISGWNAATAAIPASPFLVVDQFGYRTTAEKIAVARSPVTGFDTPASFTPSATLDVVDVTTGQSVWSGAPVAWNGGAVDSDSSHGSGDKTWWLTFTALTTPGTFVVVDAANKARSFPFQISDTVYASVFKAAQKMYYYQRFGIAKDAQYAGAAWADGVAFPGDAQCVDFLTKSNPKDLSGGWFDAGDYDKYTNWSAADVMLLLRAYSENPSAFTDDVNIPESGNGVPDILDEIKWELDWMKRMQDGAGSTGSVLSVVGEVGAPSNPIWSPPSASNATCAYGEASTSATLSTAWAFAYASMVYKNIPSLATYAADLLARAESAWAWAQANPAVFFYNNQADAGTSGLASGQQEVNSASLAEIQLQAAAILFAATGTQAYQAYVDANYDANSATTSLSGYVGPWDTARYEALLTYAITPGATATVASSIKTNMLAGINGGDNFPGYTGEEGSYGPYLAQFVWGSNQTQAQQGLIFTMVPTYGLDSAKNTAAMTAAERHVHYFHGVNPLSKVYLSNLSTIGASNSVTSFFHSWFAPGTKWSAVTSTTPGPAPGYLVGGPNPSYSLDGCCPSNCGGSNSLCVNPVPPAGQPPMKSYKDFNDGWPLDSWAVTEPDLGYQAAYVRLLSKFVKN